MSRRSWQSLRSFLDSVQDRLGFQALQVFIFSVTFLFGSLFLRARQSFFVDKVDVPVQGGYGMDFQAIMLWTRSTLHDFSSYHSDNFWANIYPPAHTFLYFPFTILNEKWSYLLFVFLSFVVFGAAIFYSLSHQKDLQKRFFLAIGLIGLLSQSYPVLFCLERGNSDILNGSLCALFIYFLGRSRSMQALIVLTIATQVKVYPGLLGFFFLLRKDVKHFLIFTVLNFLLLFVYGWSGFRFLLKNLSKAQLNPYIWQGNHSLRSGIDLYFPSHPSYLLGLLSVLLILGFVSIFGKKVYGLFFSDTSSVPVKLFELDQKTIGLIGAAFALFGLLPALSHDYKLVLQVFPWILLMGQQRQALIRSFIASVFTALLFLPPHYIYPKTILLFVLFWNYLTLAAGAEGSGITD